VDVVFQATLQGGFLPRPVDVLPSIPPAEALNARADWPCRTLTLSICEQAAAIFTREGAVAASEEYAAAWRDGCQAFRRWYAGKGQALPSSEAEFPALSMIVRNIPEARIPADYSRSPSQPSILVHDAFQYLERPGFVIGHEIVHLRNPQVEDEIRICRMHVLDLPRRALEIVARCQEARSRGDRMTLRQLAVTAQMDPGTLNNHRRHPFVEEAVRAVLPEPVEERLAAALAAEEAESRKTSQPFTRVAIARRAGLNEKTVVADPVFARRIAEAVRASESRGQAFVLIRIDSALQTLLDEWKPFSLADVARRAGYVVDFIGNIRTWAAPFHDALVEAADGSLARAIAHILEEAERDGVEASQKFLAEKLGVSEASVSTYKDRPVIGDLIRNGLSFSAVTRIRNAIDALLAEGITPSQEAVAERAGVHQGTVSRAVARNPDLAAAIPAAPPESRTKYPDPASARAKLAARQALYGGEACNTATALRRPLAQGGDSSLLEACLRMGISLPRQFRAPPATSGWLVAYLKRMTEARALDEAAAADLWSRAASGDQDKMEALIVGLRPMVRCVIEQDLREEIAPDGFKAELLEHLVHKGDEIIVDTCHAWGGQGAVLAHFRREIAAGLNQARRDFYFERSTRHQKTVSLDAPLGEDHEQGEAFTLAQTADLAARNLDPAEVAEILDPDSLEETAALVSSRDADWGLPVIRAHDKASVASALGKLLAKEGLPTVFSCGIRHCWAVFMGGSMGRLGSALQGHGGLEFYILTDGTEMFAQDVRGIFRDMVRTSAPIRALFSRFGIRLPHPGETGFVFAGGMDATQGPIIPGFAAEELLFHINGNGILVAESDANAGRRLVRELTARLADVPPEDVARALLKAREEFLTRERLKQAVQYFPGTRRVKEVRWNGWIHEYTDTGRALHVPAPDGNGPCEVGPLLRRMRIGARAGAASPAGDPLDSNCFYGAFAGHLHLQDVPVELLAGRLCLHAPPALAAMRAQKPPEHVWSRDPVQVGPHRYVVHVSARKTDKSFRPLEEIEPLLTAEYFFGARIPRLGFG